MQLTCPDCLCRFPLSAGFADGDGKRLATVVGGMEPRLARAALDYLVLFKPHKTALRVNRATKILQELAELTTVGTVCRDERVGVRRPATAQLWATGIEKMLQQTERLTLPLSGHGYLRRVVFDLAEKADASNEVRREQDLREGRRPAVGVSPPRPAEDRLANELAYLRQLLDYGQIELEEYDRKIADARARHGRSA